MEPVDVVISGIGGHFPRSKNMCEFSEHLKEGKSLLQTTTRWTPGWAGTPTLMGETIEFEKFDNTFFGMLSKVSRQADIASRVLLENVFEALVDAGVNPSTIRGTNTQVYSATTGYEMDSIFFNLLESDGYSIMGRNKCMMSNRVSYWLNLTGRSTSYDANNGWIGTGLDLAREAIQAGECDTAFVLGSSTLIVKEYCKQRQLLGLLSPDGSCNPFDIDVNGQARGEAMVALVLQRADIAKRSYGSIVACGGTMSGILPNWFLSVNKEHLHDFVGSLYRKNGIDPAKIKLLEADGMCYKDMVETELNVLDKILNRGRPKNDPLYIGSVKTLCGDTEGAAGHVSLTKLLLAMDTGIISPSTTSGKFNPNIPGLIEGRYKVIDKPTKWDVTGDTHVALSTVSVGGVVGHVVVKANGKAKNTNVKQEHHLPYLILMSARNEDTVGKSLRMVASSSFDPEYLRLTQEFFVPSIEQYAWRGYGFHGEEKFVTQRGNRRPVWFVYSGMGSQWSGMGKKLVDIPVLKETFERLHAYLKPKGVDLIHILTSSDKAVFDNVLHAFVGITAFQIALTNLLDRLGIKPDGIIGHSLGELGCSYADGCLTEEQAILAAYARGMASLKADLIPGLMAAVGLGYKEVKELLPPSVVVACRNSAESCTLSGPTEAMNKTIELLQSKNIFVRTVNVANIAYHSPYIKPAAPYLFDFLSQVITGRKLRSSKWICTSAPKDKWETDAVRYCSAEYHTNNLLSPVYFEEGAAYIPKNAITIELAPHGLLQAVLRRSLGSDVANVALTRRGVNSQDRILLEAIGKMFLEGLSPKVWHLYPNVSMPVSRNTPSLTPLVGWEHGDFPLAYKIQDSFNNITEELGNSSSSMEISGAKALLPAYALTTIWKGITSGEEEGMHASCVVFEDVYFHDLMRLEADGNVELQSTISSGKGEFSVLANDAIAVTGKIKILDPKDHKSTNLPPEIGDTQFTLNSEDIYAEMKSRYVSLGDSAKCIKNIQVHPKDWIAEIEFDGDWPRLLQSLMTLFQLSNHDSDQSPTSVHHIQKLVIDPSSGNVNGKARLHLPGSSLIYHGIELYKVDFKTVEKPGANFKPLSLRFVHFGLANLENKLEFLYHVVHLSLERHLVPIPVFKIYDVDGENASLAQKLRHVLTSEFSLNCEVVHESRDASLVLCGADSISAVAPIAAKENILLLSQCARDQRKTFNTTVSACGLEILSEFEDGKSASLIIVSCPLPSNLHLSDCKIIKMDPEETLPASVGKLPHSLVILVWERGCCRPIEKIYHQLTTTQSAEKIRLVFLMSPDAPPFSLNLPLYADQLRLNIPFNFYVDGKWGGYRLIPLPEQCRPDLSQEVIINADTTANGNGPIKVNYVGLNIGKRSDNDISSVIYNRVLDYSGEFENKVKVMGFAYYDVASGLFKRDPQLAWGFPDGWSQEEAATVPCAYGMMYYSLFEIAQLKPKGRLFITCPLTPAGQAALRIALNHNCEICVLAGSLQEQECLQKLFPKLPPKRMILSQADTFPWQLKQIFPEGVNVVVSDLTGSRLQAAIRYCFSFYGILLQIGVDSIISREYIGMKYFADSGTMFGVTEKSLLNASIEIKKKVAAWVQKGLDEKVVCPNVLRRGFSSNQISAAVRVPQSGDINKRIISLQEEATDVKHRKLSVLLNEPDKCTVIIGGSKSQWIQVAHWLARKGSKHITLVSDKPSPSLVDRHAQILRHNFRTKLKELRNSKNGSDLVDQILETGFIQAIIVFSPSKLVDEVVYQLGRRGLSNTQVISLSEQSNNFSAKCERWAQNGLKVRAALGVEDDSSDSTAPLLDWLLSSAAPPVSVLSGPAFFFRKIELSLGNVRVLPTSVDELQTLGASLRKKTQPIFRELTTLCKPARHTTEIQPLFFIKGIHGTANNELETLASNLLSPIFEVILPVNCPSLEDTAQLIVDELHSVQQRGPYTLAGDPIRTPIVARIACILEERGHASVVFLMDEGLNVVREELKLLEEGNNLNVSLLKLTLFENRKDWHSVNWNKLSWSEQISTAVSKISSLDEEKRQNVMTALDHVKHSVNHLIQQQETIKLDYGEVHFLRKGEEYRESKVEERLIEHEIPQSKLRNKQIGNIIGANVATPVLQWNIERARAVNKSAK